MGDRGPDCGVQAETFTCQTRERRVSERMQVKTETILTTVLGGGLHMLVSFYIFCSHIGRGKD